MTEHNQWTPETVFVGLAIIIALIFAGFAIKDYNDKRWADEKIQEVQQIMNGEINNLFRSLE